MGLEPTRQSNVFKPELPAYPHGAYVVRVDAAHAAMRTSGQVHALFAVVVADKARRTAIRALPGGVFRGDPTGDNPLMQRLVACVLKRATLNPEDELLVQTVRFGSLGWL